MSDTSPDIQSGPLSTQGNSGEDGTNVLESPQAIFNNVQESSLPASNLPYEGSEFYQLCYIDSAGKMRGASTPFQFLEQSAEDFVLDGSMDILMINNKSEYCMKELKRVLEEKHELKKDCNSLKEKVIGLKTELHETVKVVQVQRCHQRREEQEQVQALHVEQEEREREHVWQLKYQSLESENTELHDNNNKLHEICNVVLNALTNRNYIYESFIDSQRRAANEANRPRRCEAVYDFIDMRCANYAERFPKTEDLCIEHYEMFADYLV